MEGRRARGPGAFARAALRGGEPWYLAGALLLALGAAMAEADGAVDHIEVLHVSEIVNSLYHFNDFDKHRLGVLRKRLLKYPPKLASLTRRVRAILSEDELAEVGKFLVGVAGANFRIRDEERLALRRAYRAFRIPVKALDALLEKLEGDPGPDGARAVREEVLAGLMRETRDFAARLGIAMQALEKTGAKDNARGIWYARKPPAAPEITRDAEPDPYRDALYALLRRPDWTEADFIALGEQHGVFVAGAVRGVDAWASEFSGGIQSVLRCLPTKTGIDFTAGVTARRDVRIPGRRRNSKMRQLAPLQIAFADRGNSHDVPLPQLQRLPPCTGTEIRATSPAFA